MSSTISIFMAFVGGFAASLTPCVYPLIPVTLAIFGATSEVSRMRAFALAVTYVIGMALMYTSLGIVSALGGSLFGHFLGNPWLIASMCLFLITLSLFTLDIIKFDLAYRLQTRAGRIGGSGFAGAFLMGTVSGLVAAPCAAPLLITILGIAAKTQSAWRGAALLFSYALGFGLIFIALATFSGLVRKLPKSGPWLNLVKFTISAALLAVAIFLLQPLVGHLDFSLPGVDKLFLLLVLSTIAFLIATIGYRRNLGWVKFLCSIVLALCLYELFAPTPYIDRTQQDGPPLVWADSIERALEQAHSQKQVAMIDLFADWCATCKQLEVKTFAAPQVAEELSKLALARVDLTRQDEKAKTIQKTYRVRGLPAVLFLCAGGQEIEGSRISGFMAADDFRTHLRAVLQKADDC